MKKAIIGLCLVIFSATTQADMMLGYALGQAAAQSNTTKIVNGVPNDGFVRLWKSQAKQIGLEYYTCAEWPGYEVSSLYAKTSDPRTAFCSYLKGSGFGMAKRKPAISIRDYLQAKTDKPVKLVNVIEDYETLLFYYQFNAS